MQSEVPAVVKTSDDGSKLRFYFHILLSRRFDIKGNDLQTCSHVGGHGGQIIFYFIQQKSKNERQRSEGKNKAASHHPASS